MAKVLVVDDQRNMRSTLSIMLRDAGHEVVEAHDGDHACDLVGADSFDLVLTDLKMGVTDGIAVLRHAKEGSPLTEVIVMTAYGTIESAVEAMRLGAHDYIQKPFTEQELLVKVQKALERRRLAGEVTLLAAEFRERRIPCDVLGLEPGWQTHSYSCSYVWSEGFPDPAAMMRGHVTDLRGVHVLPGVGHWTQQERPAEVTAILLDWLKGL